MSELIYIYLGLVFECLRLYPVSLPSEVVVHPDLDVSSFYFKIGLLFWNFTVFHSSSSFVFGSIGEVLMPGSEWIFTCKHLFVVFPNIPHVVHKKPCPSYIIGCMFFPIFIELRTGSSRGIYTHILAYLPLKMELVHMSFFSSFPIEFPIFFNFSVIKFCK